MRAPSAFRGSNEMPGEGRESFEDDERIRLLVTSD